MFPNNSEYISYRLARERIKELQGEANHIRQIRFIKNARLAQPTLRERLGELLIRLGTKLCQNKLIEDYS